MNRLKRPLFWPTIVLLLLCTGTSVFARPTLAPSDVESVEETNSSPTHSLDLTEASPLTNDVISPDEGVIVTLTRATTEIGSTDSSEDWVNPLNRLPQDGEDRLWALFRGGIAAGSVALNAQQELGLYAGLLTAGTLSAAWQIATDRYIDWVYSPKFAKIVSAKENEAYFIRTGRILIKIYLANFAYYLATKTATLGPGLFQSGGDLFSHLAGISGGAAETALLTTAAGAAWMKLIAEVKNDRIIHDLVHDIDRTAEHKRNSRRHVAALSAVCVFVGIAEALGFPLGKWMIGALGVTGLTSYVVYKKPLQYLGGFKVWLKSKGHSLLRRIPRLRRQQCDEELAPSPQDEAA